MVRPSSAKELVLALLRRNKSPMTAYGLLDALRQSGVKSPPIIYRALHMLVQTGTVHKIKALGAFIACNCAPDHNHSLSVLTICHQCEHVEELHDHTIIHQLETLRKQGIRLVDQAVIELPVSCPNCI